MNVYEIEYPNGYYDWVAGRSKTEAISRYINQIKELDPSVTGIRDLDTKGATMTIMPEDLLTRYFVGEEGSDDAVSFKQWVAENGAGWITTTAYS